MCLILFNIILTNSYNNINIFSNISNSIEIICMLILVCVKKC